MFEANSIKFGSNHFIRKNWVLKFPSNNVFVDQFKLVGLILIIIQDTKHQHASC